MSNTVINWRFWDRHLQVIRWGDWPSWIKDGRSPVTWSRNRFWSKGGPGRIRPAWTPIALYEGRRYLGLLLIVTGLGIMAL